MSSSVSESPNAGLSSAPASSELDSNAYSKTLLHPKTSLPLYRDAESEELLRRKTRDELYQWQARNAKGPLFVMHDGPTCANGHIQLGHARNKIFKDAVNRFHVLMGDRVHYVPGWDGHGLLMENKALQDLKKDPCLASTIRSAARAIAEREMKVRQEEFGRLGIMADWSKESTYRTLDHEYEMRQLRTFQKMVSKGLIYRDYRPVYFSPSSRSALTESELVYKDDYSSHSIYVAFTLGSIHSDTLEGIELGKIIHREKESLLLLVWTAMPWTLSANMGIAVNPNLVYTVVRTPRHPGLFIVGKDRLSALEHILGSHEGIEIVAEFPGSRLVGLGYRSIFATHTQGEASYAPSIVASTHVTPDSGTRLVHCAPAHDAEDYLTFSSQGLLRSGMLCHVDSEGKFSQRVTDVVCAGSGGNRLVGLEVLREGSEAIVKILEGCGALLAAERIEHRYTYDRAANEPVIVTGFVNLDKIKEKALAALEEVTFFPPTSRESLADFIRSRSAWCISRQHAWGVPIPSLRHVPSGTVVLTPSSLSHILGVLDKKGVDYWWDGPVNEFLSPEVVAEYDEAGWMKGTGTMDMQFGIGTSWSMLPEMQGRKHRADVCIEGSDQHQGWFPSQLLTSIGTADDTETPASPYGTLVTHTAGAVLVDENLETISESADDIVSPMTIIGGGVDKKGEPAYGVDVLRAWAAVADCSLDPPLGPVILANVVELVRKIRDSARFMLGHIGSTAPYDSESSVEREGLGLAERYIMSELCALENAALEDIQRTNLLEVFVHCLNYVVDNPLPVYFNIRKDVLYANDVHSIERRIVIDTLRRVLRAMMSTLAPVFPYLAEEIHAHSMTESSGRSFFTNKWEPLGAKWRDPQAENDMDMLWALRDASLSILQKDRGLEDLRSVRVVIILPPDAGDAKIVRLLRREANFLKTILIASDVTLADDDTANSAAWSSSAMLAIAGSGASLSLRFLPASLHECPRCGLYARHEEDGLCTRCADVTRQL